MYLHEEYIKRHNIDIPLICYQNKSSVLLKSQKSLSLRRILVFSWRVPDRHPGYWDISYKEAVHNGWESELLFRQIDRYTAHWDCYEKTLKYIAKRLITDCYKAIELEEQTLAAWHIFLMIYDSWLATHMDVDFINHVSISLNGSLPMANRLQSFSEAQKMLLPYKSVSDMWLYQLCPLAKKDSEWLVRLINGN